MTKTRRMKIPFAAAMLATMLAGPAWATAYINSYANNPNDIVTNVKDGVTNFYTNSVRTIDLVANKVFLAQSPVIDSTPEQAMSSSAAAKRMLGTYPIYWQDVSAGIGDRHTALGFVDLMVTLIISDVMVSPFTNWKNNWRFYGDADRRNDNDIRVNAENTTYEFLDPRYKANRSVPLVDPDNYDAYNDGPVMIFSNSYNARSGDFGVLRFGVPRKLTGPYFLFLGKGSIDPVAGGTTFGQAYQVKVYTPILTNRVVPRVEITFPPVGPRWDSLGNYDNGLNDVVRNPFPYYQIPVRTPITFSAKNSFVSNATITQYEWNTGSGWVVGDSTYTATFNGTGTYTVYSRITATCDGGTLVVSNYGTPWESGSGANSPQSVLNGQPDFCPMALPFVVQVVEPPQTPDFPAPRPNPFVLGFNSELFLDFTLAKESEVKLSVLSLNGNVVKVVLAPTGKFPVGSWTASWDGRDEKGFRVPEGIYYAVLETSGGKTMQKLHVFRER